MKDTEQRCILDEWLGAHPGLLFQVVRAYAFDAHDREDLFQEQLFATIRAAAPEGDLRGQLKAALLTAENQDFEVLRFPGLNHLFQVCETGAMSEYASIPETLNPLVLEEIGRWLQAR